jgi:hypothetical protein
MQPWSWLRCGAAGVFLALTCALPAAPSAAQGPFSPTEQVFILRNEALEDLARVDPAGARRVIDLMAAVREAGPAPPPSARRRRLAEEDEALERRLFDPARNPDLQIFLRGSPEAAHELFQIIKRAGSAKGGR